MKEFLILVAIILLGFNVLRFAFSAIVLIFRPQMQGKKMPTFMVFVNFFETAAIVTGYILLVMAYYATPA